MSAWDTSVAVLVGLRQALAKATTERDELMVANPGTVNPAGYSEKQSLYVVLKEAERSLSADLRHEARANGQPFPE